MDVANTVLMVRPARFGYDAETAQSNVFQHMPSGNPAIAALAEFDAMVSLLRPHVGVVVVQEPDHDPHPDAVFPNNWFSTFPDGRVVLYPMQGARRQLEVRPELVLRQLLGFHVQHVVDFRQGATGVLEGTGSLVIDHAHKRAFACLSPRTSAAMVESWCRKFGFEPVVFEANIDGKPVYHTNVVLSVSPHFVVAEESVWATPKVRSKLDIGGRTVMKVSQAQVKRFAANVLALRSRSGQRVLVISTTAWNALDDNQHRVLQLGFQQVLKVDIPTIETVGGGSVRCMMAEIFLQPRVAV